MKTILLTNDDGIFAPGLKALFETVKHLGKIIIVAPNKPQSGMGHAITINKPLRIEKIHYAEGVDAYTSSGTPVDCVKLAVDVILHNKPDICLSGINHGANHSVNLLYSGTMSAAIEAAIEKIPSIGFSLLDESTDADFNHAKHYVELITKKVLNSKSIKNICLNVNIPKNSLKPIKGIKICSQAEAKYEENYVKRIDPRKRDYYWLSGSFVNMDTRKNTDVNALNENYVSIVPIKVDLTNYELQKKLNNKWKF